MKKFLRGVASLLIIATILFINLRTLSGFILNKRVSGTGDTVKTLTGIERARGKTPKCPEVYGIGKRDRAILRVDDVDDSTSPIFLEKFIKDAKRYNAPLVIGVVAENIENAHGLFDLLQKEACSIELALTGFDHFSAMTTTGDIRLVTEFSEISEKDAEYRIEKSKEILDVITENPIITLIPPYGLIGSSGSLGAKNAGIRVISTSGSGKYNAVNIDLPPNQAPALRQKEIKEQCSESLRKNHLCVIGISLKKFYESGATSVRDDIYKEYLGLLDDFSKNKIEFTTFSAVEAENFQLP